MESLVIVLQKYIDEIENRSANLQRLTFVLKFSSVAMIVVAIASAALSWSAMKEMQVREFDFNMFGVLASAFAAIFLGHSTVNYYASRQAVNEAIKSRADGLKNLRYLLGNSDIHPGVMEIVKAEFARLDKLLAKHSRHQ
ncbi:MAG: hypothetical protein ABL973_11235 [Micropepsaceae bacterium]